VATVKRGTAARWCTAARVLAGCRHSRPRGEAETAALDCCGPGDAAGGGGDGGAKDLGSDGEEAAVARRSRNVQVLEEEEERRGRDMYRGSLVPSGATIQDQRIFSPGWSLQLGLKTPIFTPE
jgi:hypothetical protein